MCTWPCGVDTHRIHVRVLTRIGSLYRPILSELLIGVQAQGKIVDVGYAITLQRYKTLSTGLQPCSVLLKTARSLMLLEGAWSDRYSLRLGGEDALSVWELNYHQSMREVKRSRASILSTLNTNDGSDAWVLTFPSPYDERVRSSILISLIHKDKVIGKLYQGWDPFLTGFAWRFWLAGYFPAMDSSDGINSTPFSSEQNLQRALLSIVCVNSIHYPEF